MRVRGVAQKENSENGMNVFSVHLDPTKTAPVTLRLFASFVREANTQTVTQQLLAQLVHQENLLKKPRQHHLLTLVGLVLQVRPKAKSEFVKSAKLACI